MLFVSTVAIFFISLQSFYYNYLGFSVFPVLGSLLLFSLALFVSTPKFPFRRFSGFSYFIFFIFLLFVFILFSLSVLNFSPGGFLGLSLSFISIISFFHIYYQRPLLLQNTLRYVLIMHLLCFFIQFFVWFLSAFYIDYVALISDDISSFFSINAFDFFGIPTPRFTGLYNEPSAYAVWVFVILYMYSSFVKASNIVIYLTSISILLTQSFYGVTLVSFFFLLRLFRFRSFLGLFVFVPLTFAFLFMIFNKRSSINNLGLDYRVDHTFSFFDLDVILGGELLGGSCSPVFVNIPASLLCMGGLFPLVLFFIVLLLSKVLYSKSDTIVMFLVVISKIKLFYPFFWLFLTFFLIRSVSSKRIKL